MTEVLRAKVLRTEEHKEQKSSKAKESSNKHVRNPVFMKYKKTLQVLIICALCGEKAQKRTVMRKINY